MNSATISIAVRIFSFIYNPYGEGGESRTPVQDMFLFASYSNNLQYIFILLCCQPRFGLRRSADATLTA